MGSLPYFGEAHDYSQLVTGQDYIAGESLSESDKTWVAIGLATPYVGGKVARWFGGTRAGKWTLRKSVAAIEGAETWLRKKRQLSKAKRLGVLGADSVVADDLIKELAEVARFGSGDRMVIGRYLKDDPGSFEKIAQAEGGIYYSLADDAFEALGETDEARVALANLVNERVLLNQMEGRVDRIEFVTSETYEEVLKATGSARRNEVLFLREHAAKYGYVFDKDNFMWVKVDR